jgi:hypothetical protein
MATEIHDGFRQASARQAIFLGAVISVIVGTFVLYVDLTSDPDASRLQTDRFPLPVPFTILGATLLGMGLGTQFSLLSANLHRIRAVLRPSKGRVLSWIALTLLAPIAHIWSIPFAYALGIRSVMFKFFSGNFPYEYNLIVPTILIFLYPPLLYLFSCLTISGIKRRPFRIAIFGQVWLAAYGTVLMLFGFYSGNV